MSSADLLLHPLRLRIVQAFLGDRQLTTGELLAEIDGISPATLYRQVGTLTQAGVLVVVGERQVRGTVERTYALSINAAHISAEELHGMTPEDHRRAFMAFVAGLLGDFERHLGAGDFDLEQDGAGYRTVGLWLTHDELLDMVAEIGAAVQARAAYGPGKGRTRRVLSTVLVPVPRPATDKAAKPRSADTASDRDRPSPRMIGPAPE